MLAETLAIVSAANAAISQVKTLIGHGNDISSMGRHLGAILTAEETLKAQGRSHFFLRHWVRMRTLLKSSCSLRRLKRLVKKSSP
jgi:hypothetical protein